MPHILVIDDELEPRVIIEKMLRTAGYQVTLAAGGAEALRQIQDQPADLVITDLFMPDTDGIETIAALRRMVPGLKVIAISGNPAAEPMLRVAHRLGAVETLEKPFTTEQLLAAVQRAL